MSHVLGKLVNRLQQRGGGFLNGWDLVQLVADFLRPFADFSRRLSPQTFELTRGPLRAVRPLEGFGLELRLGLRLEPDPERWTPCGRLKSNSPKAKQAGRTIVRYISVFQKSEAKKSRRFDDSCNQRFVPKSRSFANF